MAIILDVTAGTWGIDRADGGANVDPVDQNHIRIGQGHVYVHSDGRRTT